MYVITIIIIIIIGEGEGDPLPRSWLWPSSTVHGNDAEQLPANLLKRHAGQLMNEA